MHKAGRRQRLEKLFESLELTPRGSVAKFLSTQWGVREASAHVSEWLGQSSEFAVDWVGQKLLWLLDLYSPSRLTQALDLTSKELSAYDALVFGHTRPKGKSADLLAAYLAKAVNIDRTKLISIEEFTSRELRRGLYVEDGLWSGTEVVKLLTKHSEKNGPRAALDKIFDRLTFAFAVRSNLGQARLGALARHVGSYVRFRDGPEIDVLSQIGKEKLEKGALFDENFRVVDSLAAVRPTCLQEDAWRHSAERTDAEAFLRTTGKQLFEAYLTGRAATAPRYEGEEKFDWSRWPAERQVACALGMENLGLASVLGTSVPKSALPHFWMSGPVHWKGATVAWKPLFPNAIGP